MKLTEASKIREQNNEAQLKIKELEHNINKHRKDSQDAADKVHTHANTHINCLSWPFSLPTTLFFILWIDCCSHNPLS